MRSILVSILVLLTVASHVDSFSPFCGPLSLKIEQGSRPTILRLSLSRKLQNNKDDDDDDTNHEMSQAPTRRTIVQSLGLAGAGGIASVMMIPRLALAAVETTEGFAEIAARANKISKETESAPTTSLIRQTDKTMYDFSLPMEGTSVPIMDLLKQQNLNLEDGGKNAKVKAVLVVNIKQDDPVARKDIPELISLVTK
jgi:hypothetical protein